MPQIASLFANALEYSGVQGRVKGTLPEWLEGVYIRNGPGLFDLDNGNFTVNHYFDGFAMTSTFEIKNGLVTFQQKILDSDAYKKSLVAGRNVFAEFGTRAHSDPSKSLLSKVITKLVPIELTDNTVGNSYVIEGELFTAHECCFIHNIDIDSLLRKERFDFMANFGTLMMCAHPLKDSDGSTYNVGGSMLSGLKYYVIKIPPSRNGKAIDALKQAKVLTTIPSSWKTCCSYIHSFAMTKNYIIFMEQPLLINVVKLVQMGVKGKALRDSFEWAPSERNRLHIIDKNTGAVLKTKYRSEDPFFSFHFANAYEVDDQIVVDLMTYPSPLIFEKFYLDKLRQNVFVHDDPAQLNRFVLPVTNDPRSLPENENLVKINGIHATARKTKDAIVLTPQAICPAGMEFPKFNPNYQSKPYRYLYTTGSYDEGFYKNSVCKIDTQNCELVQHHTDHENEFFGEPVFIPRPFKNNQEEDDGIILSTVSSSDEKKPDYLVFLMLFHSRRLVV